MPNMKGKNIKIATVNLKKKYGSLDTLWEEYAKDYDIILAQEMPGGEIDADIRIDTGWKAIYQGARRSVILAREELNPTAIDLILEVPKYDAMKHNYRSQRGKGGRGKTRSNATELEVAGDHAEGPKGDAGDITAKTIIINKKATTIISYYADQLLGWDIMEKTFDNLKSTNRLIIQHSERRRELEEIIDQ